MRRCRQAVCQVRVRARSYSLHITCAVCLRSRAEPDSLGLGNGVRQSESVMPRTCTAILRSRAYLSNPQEMCTEDNPLRCIKWGSPQVRAGARLVSSV